MILLGVNAALGPADIGAIPESAVDLDAGILDFARPKTGIARRAILWPETIAAIRAWLAVRPEPKHEAATGRLFVTRFGQPWGQNFNSPVTNEFTKLLRRTRLMHVGRNFYSLRHTFRTVADETLDFPACNLTMGHTDNTMGGHYRARIDDSRLARVASHVRTWLFGDVVKG
jgi:integrase